MLHWKQLLHLSGEQLSAYGVERVNLACAANLPDAPTESQIEECIDRLDHYASCTRHYTERRMQDFPKESAKYEGSEVIFRFHCMTSMLQRQFGVRYNPAKTDFTARLEVPDTFIHGALLGEGGTCASLPVIYVAVGRRLGYPLKLVSTFRHCYLRWEEPGGERMNFEVGETGMDCPSDDYYATGLYAAPAERQRDGCYFRSQTPREEFAHFLKEQAIYWAEYKNYRQACESFIWASVLAPDNVLFQRHACTALDEWIALLEKLRPPKFPDFFVYFPPRRYPPPIPELIERRAIFFEKLEELLTDPERERKWWGPLRRGETPMGMPVQITVQVGR